MVDSGFSDDFTLNLIMNAIKTKINLKREDWVCVVDIDEKEFVSDDLENYRYINNGIVMFDGERLINLSTDIDDYGYTPPYFRYPEFPLDYFAAENGHNNIIWLSHYVCKAALEGKFSFGILDHKLMVGTKIVLR